MTGKGKKVIFPVRDAGCRWRVWFGPNSELDYMYMKSIMCF